MGLQMSYEVDNTGVVLSTAYFKVVKVFLTNGIAESDRFVSLEVHVFKDKTSRDALKERIYKKNYWIKGSDFTTYFSDAALKVQDKTAISKSYEYLKTLSEFSGAIDV